MSYSLICCKRVGVEFKVVIHDARRDFAVYMVEVLHGEFSGGVS